MQLKQFLNRVKQRFLPVVTYDNKSGTETHTWLGHKKVYDFEGYIVSDTYRDRDYIITRTYFPGTPRNASHKRVFNTRYASAKTGALTDEVWHNLKGKKVAYSSSAQPNAVLLLNNDSVERITTREHLDNKIQSLLDMVQTRTLIVNYDLRDMSEKINQTMAQMIHEAPFSMPRKKSELSHIAPVKIVEEVKQPVVAPAPVVEQAAPVKPKLTAEQRKDRWEEQLLKRMEKHDFLMAQKAKVEASARMDSQKKAERLASIQKRLMQNEKAQYILNTRLRALQMTQDRAIMKQFKVEERSEYKQWHAEIKQATAEIKSGTLSNEQIAAKKAELKQMRQYKKQALTDYRSAMAEIKDERKKEELRKLKNIKRQKAIFEWNMIVREKDALEKAKNAETDASKRTELKNRIDALNAQKRAVLNTFKAPAQKKEKPIRVADLKRAYQPLLPAFQKQDVKEAS